jgi:hypothetical protein
MTIVESSSPTIQNQEAQLGLDEAQLAALSFLARYSERTLEAYRHDLRGFFQWATDHDIGMLAATRPHIELFRAWMEERGLAASTIDRRLRQSAGSTASRTSPAESARTLPSMFAARRSTRATHEDSTAPSSVCSCSPRTSTTATTQRSPCCSASTAFV